MSETMRTTLPVGRTAPALRLALFAGWLVVVAWLAAHHVFWRDEVRAFSLALSGDRLVGMARAVHGEGHPLLWYLLLRVGHMLVPVREVLPTVGLAVGIAGGAFFVWRAPFRPLILAGVLFGAWMTFEYTVEARNYGLSMLLMFLLADRFARGRDGMLGTGGLLFLLCNTNVPSVILAGGFLLFRLVEIVTGDGRRWSPAVTRWSGAAALCLAGVVVCFLTVYPPFNEAAVSPLAGRLSPGVVLAAALNVGGPLSFLWPEALWAIPGAAAILAVLIVAGPLSLLRSPAGLIAAAVVLPTMLLFFQLVYQGSYRHQALYLCFLVALHWMVAAGRGGTWPASVAVARGRVSVIAGGLFGFLLLAQVIPTASLLVQFSKGHVDGQAAATARLLARPPLAQAIVVAAPEVMVEALPYYVANPTYLLRQHRFGMVARFSRDAEWHMTLPGILARAQHLQAASGRPVVILLQHPVDPAAGAVMWDEGILGDVAVGPHDAAAFLAATRLLAVPADLVRYGYFDERYWVYVLNPPVHAGVTAS